MSNVVARNENGPLTFEVEAFVEGGKFVSPGTGGLIKQTDSATAAVLGVALYNALEEGHSNQTPTDYGATAHDFSLPRPQVAVAFRGVFKLTNSHATTALVLGDKVEVSASGDVIKSAGTNPVVGQVVDPNGIAAAGGVGLVRLSL